MHAHAIVLMEPGAIRLDRFELVEASDEDVIVDMEWTGISGGTERLLWSGDMPEFPGMGYPLVPGYESVGRVRVAGANSGRVVGQRVFVGGANCFKGVRGLFGGAASRVVVPGNKAVPLGDRLAEDGILLALAATAEHAIAIAESPPELIVGHGALGRILARLAVLRGSRPRVWERHPDRMSGALGYDLVSPTDDAIQYRSAFDASGDAAIVDELVQRLKPGGEIVLAGFYTGRIAFDFAPAFMKEAQLRIAAQWQPEDLAAVAAQAGNGALELRDLITHRFAAGDAETAYRTAFEDPSCLKMILEW